MVMLGALGPLAGQAAADPYTLLAAQELASRQQQPQTGGLTQLEWGQAGGGLGGGLGGAIGGIALLAGAAGRGGKRFLKSGLSELQGVGLPEFDMRDIRSPQYRVLAERTPELMEAAVPEGAATIADSPAARAAQFAAMLGTGEVAREGLPDVDRLAAEQAARSVRGALRGGEEAAVSQLRRRGRAGAGGELQSRLAGGRVASELARDLGSQLQQLSLERRLRALGQLGTQSGQLRGMDIGAQEINADAINRFREFASQQQQMANLQNAMARERAQAYNVGTTQRIGEQQQTADYMTERENVERQNRSRMDRYFAEQRRAADIAAQYGDLATDAYNKQKAKAGQIQGVSQGLGGALGGVGGLIGGGGLF